MTAPDLREALREACNLIDTFLGDDHYGVGRAGDRVEAWRALADAPTTVRDLTEAERFKNGAPIAYEINGERYRMRALTGIGMGEIVVERWSDARMVWCSALLTFHDLDAPGVIVDAEVDRG